MRFLFLSPQVDDAGPCFISSTMAFRPAEQNRQTDKFMLASRESVDGTFLLFYCLLKISPEKNPESGFEASTAVSGEDQQGDTR